MKDDTISRRAALDAIGDKPLAWTEGEYELGLQNQWQSDVDALKALPSAPTDIHYRKMGEWDMFELITSTWYGKQYYFMQDDEIVYSRASGKYMSVDKAINEFLSAIGDN